MEVPLPVRGRLWRSMGVAALLPLLGLLDCSGDRITVDPDQTTYATVRGGSALRFSSTNLVTWSVVEASGCGSIDSTGLYRAPFTPVQLTCHVRATTVFDPSKYGTVIITVTPYVAPCASDCDGGVLFCGETDQCGAVCQANSGCCAVSSVTIDCAYIGSPQDPTCIADGGQTASFTPTYSPTCVDAGTTVTVPACTPVLFQATVHTSCGNYTTPGPP